MGEKRRRPGVEEQRRIILETAVRLFVQEGIHAVGVSKICTVAKVSRPTFYRCFDDKDALVARLYAQAVDNHVQLNLAAVLREGLSRHDMRVELDAMLDRIFERPAMAAFLFVESSRLQSPAYRIVQDAFDSAAQRLETWYQERNLTPPPRTTIKATMVACQWIVHDAIRGGLTPKSRAEARHAMWDLVWRVFGPEPEARWRKGSGPVQLP
ncbi:MAG: TetR/AcrR family transcriptional regulator [Myxococcota bacterium]